MKTLARSKCAILPLVLKGKWYDMIERGEKREEYREATDYWKTRIERWYDKYDRNDLVVEFRLGYSRNAKKMAYLCDGIWDPEDWTWFGRGVSDQPHTEWGEPEEPHYIIALGERVALKAEEA